LTRFGENGEDGSGVLGGVMMLVDSPEEIDFMGQAMVTVEEIVESDFPKCKLERVVPIKRVEWLIILIVSKSESESGSNNHERRDTHCEMSD